MSVLETVFEFEEFLPPPSLLQSPQLWVVVGRNMQLQHCTVFVIQWRDCASARYTEHMWLVDTMQMAQLSGNSSPYIANSMWAYIQSNNATEQRKM